MIASMRARYGALTPRMQVVTGSAVALVAALVIFSVWAAWSVISGLLLAKSAAAQASHAAKTGDNAALVEAVSNLNVAANRVNTVASSPPVWLAAHVPYAGRSVADLANFSHAGVSATEAANKVAPAYAGGDIFADQTINLKTIDSVLAALPEAQTQLTQTRTQLEAVQGDGVFGSYLGKYRDDALAGVDSLQVAATQLSPNRAQVLDALGANGPKNYLVPLLNNAQLRASGGAPLSVAVVRIDHGKVSVPFNGYTNGKAYKGHPAVSYASAVPAACGSSGCSDTPLWGSAGAVGFVNSNAHPDWRVSGDDLSRAWNASQPLKVDGVMALDTRAIESLLSVTGPVQTSQYGEVDQANFTDLILERSYDKFAADQQERQDVNDEIGQAVIGKLLSGNASTMAMTTTALVQDAQTRSVQTWFKNPVLEKAALSLGMGGEINTSPDSDTVAVYSRNRNMSKVDVYSQRDLTVNVTVAEDGSATVRQDLTVHNNAESHGNSADNIGYQTNLSVNDWFFVLPNAARNASLNAPTGYEKVATVPDGLGRKVLTTTGPIPAGESAHLAVEYTLPAGTFKTDGGLEYRTFLNPQPLQDPIDLTLKVKMPAGSCQASPQWDGSTYAGPMDHIGELWVRCE